VRAEELDEAGDVINELAIKKISLRNPRAFGSSENERAKSLGTYGLPVCHVQVLV
jgi:hypothetical protein